MEQIILDTDIKYLIKHLSLTQKGELLNLLLEEDSPNTSQEAANIFIYLKNQIIKKQTQKNKMKTLAQIANQSRWKKSSKSVKEEPKVLEIIAPQNTTLLTSPDNQNKENDQTFLNNIPTVIPNAIPNAIPENQQRKEPKEIKKININNNILLPEIPNSNSHIPIPTLAEVKSYILSNNYNVDAETFIDFYTQTNWQVGKSKIKNWQATIRMWHRRSKHYPENQPIFAQTNFTEDETYWHEMKEKFWTSTSPIAQKPPPLSSTEPTSHFTRFMNRIEKNDF